MQLGLAVALTAPVDQGQRVVEQAQRLVWPAGQLLGLGQQPEHLCPQRPQSHGLPTGKGFSQHLGATGGIAFDRLRPPKRRGRGDGQHPESPLLGQRRRGRGPGPQQRRIATVHSREHPGTHHQCSRVGVGVFEALAGGLCDAGGLVMQAQQHQGELQETGRPEIQRVSGQPGGVGHRLGQSHRLFEVLSGGHQLALEEQGLAQEVVAGQQRLRIRRSAARLRSRARPALAPGRARTGWSSPCGCRPAPGWRPGRRPPRSPVPRHVRTSRQPPGTLGWELAEQVPEPHLHAEFPPGALARRRHGFKQLQRPAELLLGLLVGQPRHGMVGGGQHEWQRRLGPCHRDRRPGVPGELGYVLGILRAVQAREGSRPTGRATAPAASG